MTRQRRQELTLLTAFLILGALTGCETKPDSAAPALAEAAAQSPAPACFPKVQPEEPKYMYDLLNETECYRYGLCEGGTGEADGTGQCHKWAVASDAPALPWSERLTNAALGNSIPPPEGMFESFGEMTSDSCYEDCEPVPVRVLEETVLNLETDATSPVVATIPAAACVGWVNSKLLSAARRGIITEPAYGFFAGDVIYSLAHMGEGDLAIWWRGDSINYQGEIPNVQWDPPPAVLDPREGDWRELVRADGTRGWARNPNYTDYGNCALSVN
jgi:hypothetical protein